MIVIFTGDREWTDEAAVTREILCLPKGAIIRQGLCRGLDQIARRVGIQSGYVVEDFVVIDPWPRGGPMRNQRMLDTKPTPNLVKAFHHDLTKSKGTIDMVTRAWKAGIPVEVYKK